MKAFFAIGDAHTGIKFLSDKRVLFSFAYVGTNWLPNHKLAEVCAGSPEVMIDSGVFTAWKQGKTIELETYVDWLKNTAPAFRWCMALDVITDAKASLAQWRKMISSAPTLASSIVPVWHEGDPLDILDEYVSLSELVALGRIEGRRSEQKTYEFYDAAFNAYPEGRFHALGQANPVHLEPYPFASFDSTGWQRDAAYSNAARWPFNRCSKETRLRAYIEAIETIEHKPPKQLSLAMGRRTA